MFFSIVVVRMLRILKPSGGSTIDENFGKILRFKWSFLLRNFLPHISQQGILNNFRNDDFIVHLNSLIINLDYYIWAKLDNIMSITWFKLTIFMITVVLNIFSDRLIRDSGNRKPKAQQTKGESFWQLRWVLTTGLSLKFINSNDYQWCIKTVNKLK